MIGYKGIYGCLYRRSIFLFQIAGNISVIKYLKVLEYLGHFEKKYFIELIS